MTDHRSQVEAGLIAIDALKACPDRRERERKMQRVAERVLSALTAMRPEERVPMAARVCRKLMVDEALAGGVRQRRVGGLDVLGITLWNGDVTQESEPITLGRLWRGCVGENR